MAHLKVYESEYRFCLILWENEPIKSSALAALCNERLGWSRTTTYTVIKRLSLRGIVVNENGIVRALVTQQEVQCSDIDELIETRFGGSTASFVAAFAKTRNLSEKDVADLERIVMRENK